MLLGFAVLMEGEKGEQKGYGGSKACFSATGRIMLFCNDQLALVLSL